VPYSQENREFSTRSLEFYKQVACHDDQLTLEQRNKSARCRVSNLFTLSTTISPELINA
ncbi:unnamed protein product, partial [Heterotrigona itama]